MRTFMIGWIGVALVCCGAPRTLATASPASAKAANARGMALMGKKKWGEAEAAFKQAVAENPASVKVHYNLASAASRAHDLETAVWEIVWVGDRASWDVEAKAAAKKAMNDGDLTWALKEWGEEGAQWVGENAQTVLADLAQGESATFRGSPLAESERTKMTARLAQGGAHDANCDAGDAKQGKVFSLTLQPAKLRDYKVVASLKDGVALLDPASKLLARSAPLGCTGPGESQDQLASLVYTFAIPVALGVETPHHPSPVADDNLIAVSYTNGGRREWQTNLAVFVRHDKEIVKVFEGLVASSDANGIGHVWQTPRGNLLYSGPGESKKHLLSWDTKAFKFVASP